MANSKATKKALFMSMLSLLLCFTMLMGATFAWFTDTVSSKNNRIQAGTLDVDLVMYKQDAAGNWGYHSIADGEGDIFSEATGNGINWEPGKTEIVYLGVQNLGSLALKYNILLDIVSEATEAGKKPLAEALEYAIIDNADATVYKYTSWEDVKSAVTEAIAPLPTGNGIPAAEGGVLDEIVNGTKNETNYFALAVHMKEDAGNEYQNEKVLIDVTLFATQKDAEKDSFGPEYDEPAPMGHPVSNSDELKIALKNEIKNIIITKDIDATEIYNVTYDVTINGGGNEIRRADGNTGTIFNVAAGNTLTLKDIVIDGGAVWENSSTYSLRSAAPVNSGVTATGNLIATTGNANVVLEAGTIIRNNDGANAISLATRGGGTLTINGAEISHNRSAAGAIWGGGNIIINEGSKINYNHATSIGGAIRMVDGYNNITFIMNGGEMNYNTSDGTGGAIWGGNRATYTFNGGEMAYNSATAGGAIWTGTYEKYIISGDFKMHDNTATELGGAIRFGDHASLTMTGGSVYNNTVNGESDAFFVWNNSMSITGGEIRDNFTYGTNLGLTIGMANITGIINYDLGTNHKTAYLAEKFNGFKFSVNEAHADVFNFKPAAEYSYTEGDEAKLICINEGYATYWDAANGVFKLKAE